jgi:hypothetical protein
VDIYLYGEWGGQPLFSIFIYLEQSGNQVIADPPRFMSMSGDDFRFELQGVVVGNTLEGSMSWDDFGEGDRSAPFRFIMSDDGLSFRGTINIPERSYLNGNWVGTRSEIPTEEKSLEVKFKNVREMYAVGETADFTVAVSDKVTKLPIQGATVTFRVTDNRGALVEESDKTDESGSLKRIILSRRKM